MSVKGNQDSKPKNYYGDIAGLLGAGPVDELVSVIIDGKTVWPSDKGWADDILELTPINYKRKSNVARIEFASPHRIKRGGYFILSNMADSSFDELTAVQATDVSATVIRYANVGANVAVTTTDEGSLLKAVTYIAGDIVRYGTGGMFRCVLGHDTELATAPPNPTYWESYSAKRSEEANPYQFSIADSTTAYGTGYFYWGTPDQNLRAGSFLAKHPPYRNCSFLELDNFLFGPEREAAPNIQVFVRRKGNQTIITGASAELSDGQCNPLAACAELLLGKVFGIGQADAIIDVATWQDVADSIPTSAWISPLLDSRVPFREFVARLLSYYDGWFRFNGVGAIEAGKFAHNEAPPAFDDTTTIDFNDILADIEYEPEDWDDTFSQTVCKFRDRARAWQDASRNSKSGLNQEITGEPTQTTVSRPWILRESQALEYASEWGKIFSQRKISGKLKLRPEKVVSIKAGSLFLMTHDATALTVICRCNEIIYDAPGSSNESVALSYESERGFAPLPYQPTIRNTVGNQLALPETIDPHVFVQPPPALLGFEKDFVLTILAGRKHTLTRGYRQWLLVDDVNDDFYSLGEQREWHTFGRLTQNYANNLPVDGTNPQDDTTETLQVEFDEMQASEDIDNISATQSADAVNDDNLLVWIFNDADYTQFEICTMIAIRIDAGVYKLKVRRARFGTEQQSFVTGDRVVIGYRRGLQFLTHQRFNDYSVGATTITMRLQGFTAVEDADLADSDLCPDINFTFADPYAPVAAWNLIQRNGVDLTVFSTIYDTADTFKVGFDMVSKANSLRDALLIIKNGSFEQTIWSQNFQNETIAYALVEFKFPYDGTWDLCIVLRDAAGRVSKTGLYDLGGGSYQTIKVETGGSGASGQVSRPYALPTRNPRTSIYPTVITFNVSLHTATPGADIYYQIETLAPGDIPVEPSQVLPGAWIHYTGVFVFTSHLHFIKRMWMFAKDPAVVLTNSPTTFQNY